MKKRDYKEQERQRRYYFFDYLFWLGEMAQRHYKGEPRRPDGESMLMLCIMIFIYEPIFLTTAHFLFDSTVFEWFTVAMIAGIVAILTDGSSAKVEGLPCAAYHGRSPSGSTQRSLAISD